MEQRFLPLLSVQRFSDLASEDLDLGDLGEETDVVSLADDVQLVHAVHVDVEGLQVHVHGGLLVLHDGRPGPRVGALDVDGEVLVREVAVVEGDLEAGHAHVALEGELHHVVREVGLPLGVGGGPSGLVVAVEQHLHVVGAAGLDGHGSELLRGKANLSRELHEVLADGADSVEQVVRLCPRRGAHLDLREGRPVVEAVAVGLEAHVEGLARGEGEGLHVAHGTAGLLAGDDGLPVLVGGAPDGDIEDLDALLGGGLHEEADGNAVDVDLLVELEGDVGALAVDGEVGVGGAVEEVAELGGGVGVVGVEDGSLLDLDDGAAASEPVGAGRLVGLDDVDLDLALLGVFGVVDASLEAAVVEKCVDVLLLLLGCRGRGRASHADVSGVAGEGKDGVEDSGDTLRKSWQGFS